MRLRAKQASEIAFNSIRKQINHRSSFVEKVYFRVHEVENRSRNKFLALAWARSMHDVNWLTTCRRRIDSKRIAHWLIAPPESISVPLNMNCSLFPFLACAIKTSNRKTKQRLSTVPLTSWIARPSSSDKNKTSSDPNSSTSIGLICAENASGLSNYSRHQFVSWDSTMSMKKHPPWWWQSAMESEDRLPLAERRITTK